MLFRRRTYLDYASGMDANASSAHKEGRAAKRVLDEARRTIARILEVQTDDVIFTSGATEANAIAILGRVRATRSKITKPHVLYLPSSHASITENVRLLEKEGAEIEPLIIQDGAVDAAALERQLRPETVLVTMEAVCGETGIIWNTHSVGTLTMKRGVTLHVDASQAPYTEKLTRAHFAADLLTLDGAKVGARGIGILISPRLIELTPLYEGGGQERGVRPGSEATELAKQFAQKLARFTREREAFALRSREFRALVVEELRRAGLNHLYINEGNDRNQAPHILNLSLVGRDTDYLVTILDEAGFAVSTRSACETDSEEGSRAVAALFGDRDRAMATIRISWGHTTRKSELRSFVRAFRRSVAFLDDHMRQESRIDTLQVR